MSKTLMHLPVWTSLWPPYVVLVHPHCHTWMHLPMWSSFDFIINAAKFALARADLRKTLLFLKLPLLDEGSKVNVFATVKQ